MEILKAIDNISDEIVSFLQQLVQIPSVTGQETEIQLFLAATLQQMGLKVDVFEPNVDELRGYEGFLEPELPFDDRPNVVAVWEGRCGGRSLLLNGHVDTVPFEPVDGWRYGPLSGILKEGCVWGRGSSDMKAGLASMTMAVAALSRIGWEPAGDVILEYVVDEERTGLGTLACVHRGYRADAGICCETSDLQVMAACIGRMWFTIHLFGKAEGISVHWRGVSAIEKGIKIVQAVEDLERMRWEDLHHPLYPDNRGALACTVTMFHAGAFPSIPSDEAVLRGSMGLMPFEDPLEVKAQLEAQIMRVAQADPWLRLHPPTVSIDDGYVAAGAEIPVDHAIVQLVKEKLEQLSGDNCDVCGRMGAADTRFLIREGQTPTVIFGPGVTAEMHAMNERVPVENLLLATKVLALAIQEWCG